METEKQAILTTLDRFVRQRSGMDYRNYGDLKSYRNEARSITRDLHDARTLLRSVELQDRITAEHLKAGFSAFAGRLTCTTEPVYTSGKLAIIPGQVPGYTVKLDYCAGQYFPTEYRKAVCAVLASVLWAWQRENMPAVIVKDGEKTYPHVNGSRNVQSAGDWLRTRFQHEFGRGLASRWFQ